jgi:hypothetical protein
VDQSGDFLAAAGIENIQGSLKIGAEVQVFGAPDTWDGSGMEDGINVTAGMENGAGIANIAVNEFCAGLGDGRIVSSAEDSDGMALFSELFDDVETEKATSSGDEGLHVAGVRLHGKFQKSRIYFSWRVFGKTRKDWNFDQLIVILVSSGYVLQQ